MGSWISRALDFAQGTGITPVSLAILTIVLLLFWKTPTAFRKLHYGANRLLGAITRRPAVAVVIAGAIPVLLRIALMPWHPIPAPTIHDEFSYLLAGDTFAHGRLTNPPHPLFQFFETYHVLSFPTYMSKYPPVQGLLLAAGQVLFGHPYWGVLLSIGLMTAVSCWMLQGWLPSRWALLGAIAIGLQFGVGHSWANSYWGGAPAAIGAGLVLGSFARLMRYRQLPTRPVRYGVLFALGVIILLNSRPWEGIAIFVPVGIVTLAWAFGAGRMLSMQRFRTVLVPAAAVLTVGAATMLYYNARVTGSPLAMPYTVVHKAYSVAPLFVWQSRTPAPEYRHAVMKRFYLEQEPQYQSADKQATFRGWLSLQPSRMRMAKDLLFGNFFLFLCIALVFYRPARPLRLLLLVLALFIVALWLESWNQIHYFGPVIGIAAVLKLTALRQLSAFSFRSASIGMALAMSILLCSGVRLAQGAVEFPTIDAFATQRADLQKDLESMPGSQVVLVRYSETHTPSEEWVYNGADIDGSKVVWAREMTDAENQKLFDYFAGRTFWLLAPDDDPLRLLRLPSQEASGSTDSISKDLPNAGSTIP
jgi:hypothetical protein